MIERIESLRKRLDDAIVREGIRSKEVLEISVELDKLISQYYNIKKEKENQK